MDGMEAATFMSEVLTGVKERILEYIEQHQFTALTNTTPSEKVEVIEIETMMKCLDKYLK